MAIYTKKNNERIINSTIRIDPGCYAGNRVFRFIAAVEKLRIFYLTELIADHGPEEINTVVNAILHPEYTIRPLWEVERDTILHALTLLGDDKDAAAKALEIGLSTLCEKLKQYEARPQESVTKK